MLPEEEFLTNIPHFTFVLLIPTNHLLCTPFPLWVPGSWCLRPAVPERGVEHPLDSPPEAQRDKPAFIQQVRVVLVFGMKLEFVPSRTRR